MEYAISLERARQKDGRSENIYIDNPLRTCRSTPCQTLLPDSTAWNKATTVGIQQRDNTTFLSGGRRSSPVGSYDGAVRLPLPHRVVAKSSSFGRISPVVQAKGNSSSCSGSMQLVCGQKYSPGRAATTNPEDIRLRPGGGGRSTPNNYFRSDVDQFQTSPSSSTTPLPREPEIPPQIAASNGDGATVTGKIIPRGPSPVCPRCGRPRNNGVGEEPDEDGGGGGTVVATAAYDQDRVVDAVSCLCCVKAIFYHCCSDEDDDARCSDAPCSCAAGRPMCCPRWACLVVAGATCLPCLILYWPVRILVRLFAGCRRRRRARNRRAFGGGNPDRCCCDAAAAAASEKF